MSKLPTSRSMQVFHGEVFHVLPEWKERLAQIGLNENSDWTRLSSEQAVSGSYNTTSNFRFELEDGSSVFFKRYVYRKIRFKHWLQPSKAAVEAAGFNELKALGIPTLQTVAYGERRRLGLLQATFIVTRGEQNTIELDQFLARQWYNMSTTSKRTILKQLQAILIKQLQTAHNAGFYHWDLKLRNVLLQHTTDNALLIWIDCPRSRRKTANEFDAVVNDFSAMARVACRVLTPGQQMRFLLDYYDGNREKARKLYRAVAAELVKRPPRPYWHLLAEDDPMYIRNINKQ
ncbi:MAG: lipopolysaccharide kinase InaA family protein [Gammaproteobacteria bacterium]|nr:lipopolysaccharide kinase InaA family protein [Gammaproteobacteria bacterium]